MLGVLLAGIVALNVVTLSLAAAAGHIDQNIVRRSKRRTRSCAAATRSARGSARVRHEAAALGLEMAAVDEVASIEPSRGDVAVAAQRLAAAGTGY